jgi:hypothetical protein
MTSNKSFGTKCWIKFIRLFIHKSFLRKLMIRKSRNQIFDSGFFVFVIEIYTGKGF